MPLLPGKYPLEGVNIARGDIITIEDAQILWPNFSGEAGQMNAEGDRNFNLWLTQKQADNLTADGWNVKCKLPREGDEEQVERCVLKITVKFKVKPPRVKMIGDKSRNETILNEELIGLLDTADIKTVDMTFEPYFWELKNGNIGVSAYLRSMYVEVVEDELDMKWDAKKEEALV